MSKHQPAQPKAEKTEGNTSAAPEATTSTASTDTGTNASADASDSASTATDTTSASTAQANASDSTATPASEAKPEDVTAIPIEAIEGLQTVSKELYARMKASIRASLAEGKDADLAFHTAVAEGADSLEQAARKMRNEPTFSVNPEKIASDTKPPAMVRTSTLLSLSAIAMLVGGALGVGAHAMLNRNEPEREALNLPN